MSDKKSSSATRPGSAIARKGGYAAGRPVSPSAVPRGSFAPRPPTTPPPATSATQSR